MRESEHSINKADIEIWREQLDFMLRDEIDGTEAEGDWVVQYVYIRDSIEYKGLVKGNMTVWYFTIRRAWAHNDEIETAYIIPSVRLVGVIHTAIDDSKRLILQDVDFFENIRREGSYR